MDLETAFETAYRLARRGAGKEPSEHDQQALDAVHDYLINGLLEEVDGGRRTELFVGTLRQIWADAAGDGFAVLVSTNGGEDEEDREWKLFPLDELPIDREWLDKRIGELISVERTVVVSEGVCPYCGESPCLGEFDAGDC